MSGLQGLLLTLLLQVGLMVGLASLVAAVRPLREVLSGDRDELWWRLGRLVLEGCVLLAGLKARLSLGYEATDLSLEGTFLVGWAHGSGAGVAVAVVLGAVALNSGWSAALPFLILVGIAGAGLARRYENASTWMGGRHTSIVTPVRELVICGGVLVACKAIWALLGWPGVVPPIAVAHGVGSFFAVLMTSAISVAAPLWIWRGLRVEGELMRRTRQIEQARMESLMERFRPHFLFNTLSAIVSLMRTDVEGARSMTLKLAGLLRRSLEEDVYGFVPLQEELRFADDYLSIESIRHGDRLRVERRIPEDIMEFPVPRMILQPLVENAIMHGIDPKVEGGTLTLTARKNGLGLVIEVADDGVGLSEDNEGIGLNNLRARLKLAYGEAGRVELQPGPDGQGTRAVLNLPPRRRL